MNPAVKASAPVTTRQRSLTSFQIERVAHCREEIMALAHAHGREFTYHSEVKGSVNPDWDLFINLESQGKFRIATLRVDGKLAGYWLFLLTRHVHHRDVMRCMEDTFYVAPKYRRGWTGYRFLKFCVAEMEATGAPILTVSNKVKADYGAIWKRLGFVPEEIMYSKVVRR